MKLCTVYKLYIQERLMPTYKLHFQEQLMPESEDRVHKSVSP